jgi:L-fuconate dehydratase
MKIVGVTAKDIRFPTSRLLDGSDAMHKDPDYSAAYAMLHTDGGYEGHGMTFTIGRGNELCVAAIESLAPLLLGQSLADITANMGAFWHRLVSDSQFRWLGPEKGIIHLATAALVNAVWDLWAKVEGKPLWKLLADMTPQELVHCLDFTYVTDVLTPEAAVEMLTAVASSKAKREAELQANGYPAYITSAGWLGYSDDKIRHLCRESLAARVGPTSKSRWVSTWPMMCAAAVSCARRLGQELQAHGGRQPDLGCAPGHRLDGTTGAL